MRWPGVIEESHVGQESLQADVAALAAKTIAAFVDSRQREGRTLDGPDDAARVGVDANDSLHL